MNKRTLLYLTALAAGALGVGLGGDVYAADPPQAPVAAPAKKDAPAAPAADAKDTGPTPAAKPADAKATPLHFEPTEKTRADFEVSFPSDI